MKYCSKCGKELFDEAVICPQCGCPTEHQEIYSTQSHEPRELSTIQKVTKAFMIVETVLGGIYILPLAWCLPMTISYCKKLKKGEPIGTGFKVCSLIFVSLIAGILMLCDNDN
ncbi:MAG: hypothetical protein J6S23_05720 [Clostridia bacterium]|nr:hypothetical protein [Clostridia bacterium]